MNLDLLMAGTSESGKTTFLAALYEVMGSRQNVSGLLRLREKPADYQYFFDITQRWLEFKELDHSNINGPRHTEMPLLSPADQPFDLRIPDVVGESFEAAWKGTEWPEELAEIADSSNGLLLFAHGGKVVPPLRLTPGESGEQTSEFTTKASEDDWDPGRAPTQTKLADLLEGINEHSPDLPTAVVISAWDEALTAGETSPDVWLQINLPLLWQMLEGRRQSRPYAVFGISAQGGDVTDQDTRDKLAKVQPNHERIIVQRGEARSSDIGAPIDWLLDQRP
jgi:Double-GTPase 1